MCQLILRLNPAREKLASKWDIEELTFNVVMTTLEGWIPTGTVAAFDFSTVTRSTWMTHFFRYTWP